MTVGFYFIFLFQSDSPVARQTMEDKRSKSIEEREEQYNKVRERIFNQDVSESMLFTVPVKNISTVCGTVCRSVERTFDNNMR